MTSALEGVPLPPPADSQGVAAADPVIDGERAARALALRVQGLTYAQMAEEMGYTDRSSVRQLLMRAVTSHQAENVAELRAIENEAYLADLRVIRGVLANPDTPPATRLRAIDTRTRAAARHARLNGLDAPTQIAISADVSSRLEEALAEARDLLMPADIVDAEVEDGDGD